MAKNRALRVLLACLLAALPSVIMAQAGAISGVALGRADDYMDYAVQLRDTSTGQPVGAPVPLNPQAQFSFTGLSVGPAYLVELIRPANNNEIVCTEGPYTLMAATPILTNVEIKCGWDPVYMWLILAGGGTAAVVAIATQSSSE
jgi:hypothetical protein